MSFMRVRGLGKAYKRYRTRAGRLAEWFGASARHDLVWVLRDISFDIAPGEAVGIIGPNGAGKSTLLKLITGTIRPTTGAFEAGGYVSALLELGIGFHPEFTGRQNVRMAGHLQGIPGAELDRIVDEVAAFAELGDYFDRPVRIYSTGMQVRLAFSIATAVRPDILIVDEALSVGDIYFQQKCYYRIRAYREAGTTLLFVTHSLATVYNICSRALYLEQGVLQLDASPKEAIDLYQARVIAKSQKAGLAIVAPPSTVASSQARPPVASVESERSADKNVPLDDAAQSTASTHEATSDARGAEAFAAALETGSYYSEGVSIESVSLLDEAGRHCGTFFSNQYMIVQVVGRFERPLADPHFGFQVRDRLGQPLFMTTTHALGTTLGPNAPASRIAVRFRFRPLLFPGQYTITAGIANRGRFDGTFEQSLVRHQDAASFTVIDPIDAPRWGGIVNLQATVELVQPVEGTIAQ